MDQPARAPRALGEDEVRRLLRAARRTGSTRDRALLALLSGTGLRLAEAAALDVDDVPTTERTGAVHVRAGKGERPRTVPLLADARTQLRRWIDERTDHPAAQRGEDGLWLGRRGRLTARQLQRIVAQLGADARLTDFSAHILRHTAATRWLRAGADVVVVAGLLGHSSLDTTRTYTNGRGPPTGTWRPRSRLVRSGRVLARPSGRPTGCRPAQDRIAGALGQPAPDAVGLGHPQRVRPARRPDHTAHADGRRGLLALFAVQPALAVRVEEQLRVGVLAGRAVLPSSQLGHRSRPSVPRHEAPYRPDCPAVATSDVCWTVRPRRKFPPTVEPATDAFRHTAGTQRTARSCGGGAHNSMLGRQPTAGCRRTPTSPTAVPAGALGPDGAAG